MAQQQSDINHEAGTLVNPFDIRTLPRTYSQDQANTLGSVLKHELAQARQGAAQHLPPLEIGALEQTGHVIALKTMREGRVIEEDDIRPDGSSSKHTFDKNGNEIVKSFDKNGRLTSAQTLDKDGHLVRTESRDARGNTTITAYDKSGSKTEIRYDSHGKVADVQKKDSSGHITFDEHIAEDGTRIITRYDKNNKTSAIDVIDKNGQRTSHTEYDTSGRETISALYQNGKKYSETRANYDNKTGQSTQTHIGEQGYVDSVRISNADGSYKEYGYNQDKEQTSYEVGSTGENGGYNRYYQADPEFQRRPLK